MRTHTNLRQSAAPKSLSDLLRDDIVDEIHEYRAQLAAKFGYDLEKLFEHLREQERQNPAINVEK